MKRKDFSQKKPKAYGRHIIMPILKLIGISFQKPIYGFGKKRAISETPALITHHFS
jgi:hypothetical protein